MASTRRKWLLEAQARAVESFFDRCTDLQVDPGRRTQAAHELATATLKLHLFDRGYAAARERKARRRS